MKNLEIFKNAKVYNSDKGSELFLLNDVTETDFNNIKAEILKKGGKIIFENKIDDNYFLYFVSSLYNISVGYFKSQCEIRIVFDDNSLYKFPCFSQIGNIVPNGKTSVIQFEVGHSLIDCGMCYIFTLSDGSFIIIDSAHMYSINDCDRLHSFLRERTPVNEKIRISGWFFTHGHTDHICQFTSYLKYCMEDTVIDGLYFNFISDSHKDGEFWMDSEKISRVEFYKTIKEKNVPIYRMHTGMTLNINDYKITSLCCHEDIFPNSNEDYNDSSLVLMFEAGNTKVLIPGDAAIEASKILEKRYPAFLKADIVQCSHHGHTGTSGRFYELVSAHTALVPNTEIKFNEEYEKIFANKVMLNIAKRYYISSNGTVEIPIPFNENYITVYPDETFESFKGIYDLWSYEYPEDFKEKRYKEYLSRGGKKLNEYDKWN